MTKGFLAKAEWTIVAAPQTFRGVWLGIAHNNGQTVAARDIELVQADLGGETARNECARVTTGYTEMNAHVEHCEVAIEALGGHSALAIRLTLQAPQYPAKLAVRVYVLPYGREQLAIVVMTPVFLEAETKPEIDRVLATLAIP